MADSFMVRDRQILILENLVLTQATGPPQAQGDFAPEHGGTKNRPGGAAGGHRDNGWVIEMPKVGRQQGCPNREIKCEQKVTAAGWDAH